MKSRNIKLSSPSRAWDMRNDGGYNWAGLYVRADTNWDVSAGHAGDARKPTETPDRAVDRMSCLFLDVVTIANVIKPRVVTTPARKARHRCCSTGSQCVRKPQATNAKKLARRTSRRWRVMFLSLSIGLVTRRGV